MLSYTFALINTILHSRLEAVTQGVKMYDTHITFDIF